MRLQEHRSFITHDGLELRYRHWPAHFQDSLSKKLLPRQAILLFHRSHEHGGRMAHLVDELNLPHCDFFAWDARGHGSSAGARGDSPGFAESVLDVQYFVSHIQAQHGIVTEDMAVLAQGSGGALIATWVHDFAPKIRALVLAAPTFSQPLFWPFVSGLLKLLYRLRGNFLLPVPLKAQFLTRDRERIRSFDSDPLIHRLLSVRLLLQMQEAAQRVLADTGAISVPTQLLIAGRDFIAGRRAQERFFLRLGTIHKEKHRLPGFLHDCLGERRRSEILQRVRRFVLHQFERPFERRHGLLDADRCGSTCAEVESLKAALPRNSLKAHWWWGQRMLLRIGSQFSDGLKLGFASGFDSASTLDYACRNHESGKGVLGRLLDRLYLDSLGFRAIRQRKQHVQELLHFATGKLREADTLVRIVDIAAGHGRSILEALESLPQPPDSVLLRDASALNVRQGNQLIALKGLGEPVEFVKGDAFDRTDLALLNPKPTVVVICGLYELFVGNQKLRESLAGLAAAMEKGSWLLYTNQPWHPQLECIARTLTRQDGKPWVMRRRTQAEMDQLVDAAGFRKVTQRIDQWGMFSVSLAQRLS